MKQIIAIGGGGFGGDQSDLKIEKYILAQSHQTKPKIAFLPQASNEDKGYIIKFFETFTKLGGEPSWVSLFGRVSDDWKTRLLSQDIIYVGGGNTKSMIALWKAWGLDKVLAEAYEKGIILCGVSAGAICWFEEGITDSVWPLGTVNGLGFLKGSLCPHFDSERERQAVYRDNVNAKKIQPGLALEDHTAVHFINNELSEIVQFSMGKKIIKIGVNQEKIIDPQTIL